MPLVSECGDEMFRAAAAKGADDRWPTLKKKKFSGPKIIQIADEIIHPQKCKKNLPSYTGIIQRYTAIIQRYTAIIQLRRSGEAKIIQQLYTSSKIILCQNLNDKIIRTKFV